MASVRKVTKCGWLYIAPEGADITVQKVCGFFVKQTSLFVFPHVFHIIEKSVGDLHSIKSHTSHKIFVWDHIGLESALLFFKTFKQHRRFVF